MTREEAAKVLEKQFDESCGDYRYQNKDKLDYEDALWLAIAALREQMDWISVKDRKEEKRGRIYMAVRTIIFRGKRIDNGEWVEGSYCHAEKLDRSGDEHFIIEYSANGSSHRVDPDTVGQYVGLKDKNGKRIFEGDMIKPFDDDIDKMVVEFHNGQFLLCLYGERGYMAEYGWEEEGNYGCFEAEPLSSYGDDIEVIGNIHDNKDLWGGNEL